MPEPELVDGPAISWRVERASNVLRFAQGSVINASTRAGGRWDVFGGGVLYTATTARGAFAETLAAYRPKASLAAKMAQLTDDVLEEDDFPAPGQIDSSYFELRRLRSLRLDDPLPFVDVDHARTHTYLTGHAATELLGAGMENIDNAIIRGSDRRITREIAAWVVLPERPHR